MIPITDKVKIFMRYNYLEKLKKYRHNKSLSQKILTEELEKLIEEGVPILSPKIYDIAEALGVPISEVRFILKKLIMDANKDKNSLLLEGSCRKYGINTDLIRKIIDIEKSYQLKDKRMGIYDKLKEVIEHDH